MYKYLLGIDTSCDDTSVGIIKVKGEESEILANIRFSQLEDCTKYGGVVPEVAARTHLDNIKKTFSIALEKSGIILSQIDYFSATVGPGLIGSLIIGSQFCKTLAYLCEKPFIPVHHMEGHMASVNKKPPFLALIISGGHSLIVKCDMNYNFEILCSTLDDSAGEVFDKIGRELKMPFPSGPFIEILSLQSKKTIKPLQILKNKLAFSFSGLKTKCLKMLEEESPEDIARFLENSIANHLIDKLEKIILLTGISEVVVCGGVSANQNIKDQLSNSFDCFFPDLSLCCDNGVMIALAARIRILNQKKLSFNIEEFSSMSLNQWTKEIC